MGETTQVVVIGAGQAGLSVSYLLTQAGVRHAVLERGAIGESWRSQRWDSFMLNTPNWSNSLPGLEFNGDAPDAFADRDELVSYFERYVRLFDLPVRQRTPVKRVKRRAAGDYEVLTETVTLRAQAVVLAAGSMNRPRVPDVAAALPGHVLSLSAGSYKNPEALPDGSVMVVGSGQSGCQIAEELARSGRSVFLSASRVGRAPRVYRGRDIVAWMRDLGMWNVRVDELEDPATEFEPQPQVSGTDGGHTVSLQSLACDGVTLVGRVTGISGSRVALGDNLRQCIDFGDDKSRFFKTAIDEWIDRQGFSAEPPGADPGEPPLPDLKGSDRLRQLDLHDAQVRSVIWCTGFDADWSWVDVDVFHEDGRPKHHDGVTDSNGLYFVGHPWLSKRSSGILFGVPDDATRIVEHLRRELARA